MQVFLPYADITKTVQCLDRKRLCKQRLEARQIYNIITGNAKSNAWANHPAVKMFRGYPVFLALYYNHCLYEWENRGYKNIILTPIYYDLSEYKSPPWFGDNLFHQSHRQTLLYKNFEWYSQFGWKEIPKYEYVWPTMKEKVENA